MSKTRMAGTALEWLFGKNPDALTIGMRVGPDILFGGMEALSTPGDITDKVIAGTGSALGGLGGGLLLGKLGGDNDALTTILDMAGSIGGDFGGRFVSDQVLKGKDLVTGGKGQTPWEKMGSAQEEQMKDDAKTQILAELGLLPSSFQSHLVDPTLAANGLGG